VDELFGAIVQQLLVHEESDDLEAAEELALDLLEDGL